MKNKTLRIWVALILVIALCAGLAVPAVAVSDRVTFTGIDTLMIYNPEVDYVDYEYYSAMSTGNMSGQIKTAGGNFNMIAKPGAAEIPYRDFGAELREEMKGFHPVISGPVNEAESFQRIMPSVAVGTKKTFFYWPDQGYDYESETAEFTCVYVGEHCLIWGYDFSDAAMAKEMGKEFDDLIYANNTTYFGTSRFMDQGEKMNILVYTFYEEGEPTNVIGFFWGMELYSEEDIGSGYAAYYNLGMPIIHINTDICTNEGNMFADYGAITVAHEHQHLINMSSTLLGNGYWYGISMGTWLNEAMSKEAEELSYPGMVVDNGYISGSYNDSLDISGGQSLYNFTTYYDIGVYGQGFLFSEYIKQLYGGPGVYKAIHDHWRTAPEEELTDAAALYNALPQSVRSEILGSVNYSVAVNDGFSGEEEEFLSKLALSFHAAAALKETDGIYGMPSTCSEASPRLFTDARCDIECGGRIFVKTKNGNSYTVPADADRNLIYVGFKNGEMVIAPTTAENHASAAYTVQAISNDTALGTVSVSGNVITAYPAEGCGFAHPAYTVISGSADVVQNGTTITVYPTSDCTVRVNFERRNDALDVWDGSVADTVPISGNVYTVTTCAQLAKLAQLVNNGDNFSGKTVRLESDLDLNELQWTPIGKGTAFRGIFAGNGYSIFGLTIESGGKYTGLFGKIGVDGAVTDVNLVDSSVSGETYVGALVGECYSGTISGCTVSGMVTGTGNSVALLCGSVNGVSVLRCGAEGFVNAPRKTGGLVGNAEGASAIKECWASASVTGESNVGGLLGYASGSPITNCYSRSAVSGTNNVGGIAGNLVNGTVTNCYWSGTLSAQSARGGIAGFNSGTSFSGCLYSSEGCSYGANDEIPTGVSPRPEEALKQKSSYSGWDFLKVWKMVETANNGMPVLVWQEFAPTLLSEGLTFDKSAVSNGCVDLTVSFAGNGNRLLGLLDVDDQYVTVSRGSGAPDTLTVSLYYLITLPVGANTLYARYSNGFTVPFTVEVVDTAPDYFDFKIDKLAWDGANANVAFRLSAPEEKEVSLVFAAYMSGRMMDASAETRTLTSGFNEVEFTLDIPWEDGMECAVFLMTENGLIPLREAYPFSITVTKNGSSMHLNYSL